MIDSEGFRPNVGIILANEYGQVLWAKRIGHNAWQFPQGGIQLGETPEQAVYRDITVADREDLSGVRCLSGHVGGGLGVRSSGLGHWFEFRTVSRGQYIMSGEGIFSIFAQCHR